MCHLQNTFIEVLQGKFAFFFATLLFFKNTSSYPKNFNEFKMTKQVLVFLVQAGLFSFRS